MNSYTTQLLIVQHYTQHLFPSTKLTWRLLTYSHVVLRVSVHSRCIPMDSSKVARTHVHPYRQQFVDVTCTSSELMIMFLIRRMDEIHCKYCRMDLWMIHNLICVMVKNLKLYKTHYIFSFTVKILIQPFLLFIRHLGHYFTYLEQILSYVYSISGVHVPWVLSGVITDILPTTLKWILRLGISNK